MDTAPTILVVDDRSINREFLTSLFGYAGYRVQLAADGIEALRLVADAHPDLVITDVLMPIMDGVELARQLQSDPATAAIPIVFYTATYRLEEARELARSCGARLVIAKPSSPRAILETVATLLGRPQALPPQEMSAPGLLGGMASNLTGLSELQRQLQRMFQQGQALLNEGGQVQALSTQLEQSLAAAQVLGLRLTALIELGLELASERDPDRLLKLFVRAAQDILNVRHAAAGLMDQGGRVVHLATRGLPDAVHDALATQPPSGLIAQALRQGTPQSIRDWSGETPPPGLPDGHPSLRTLLALPVRSAVRTYGWLYLADKLGADAFATEDEQIAATFAAQLALACENLALFEEAQEYARELEREVTERRASELRFRQLAENIREVFWLVNPTMSEFFYVSPIYEEIWGRSRASLYAEPDSWREAVHPDDRRAVLEAVSRMRETGQVDIDFRLLRPNGSLRWINARGFPIRDERGELIRIAGLAEDVTERKRAADRIARLNRVYAVLSGINSAIVRIHEPQALFEEVCRIAVEEGTFALAWIGLPDGESLRPRAWRARDPQAPPQAIGLAVSAADEAEARRVLESGRAAVCNDLRLEDLAAAGPLNLALDLEVRSRAALPLRQDGALVGVLMLYAREAGFFDAEEQRLLDELAGDISFALQYIAKAERLDYLAYYDPLTGLPNRSLFVDRLGQLLQGAHHDGTQVAVILVDLDHFKRINDTWGHAVGDMALQRFASLATGVLRSSDLVGRLGGEEFAIVMGRTTLEEATEVAERLRTAVAEPDENFPTGLTMTVSMGMTSHRASDTASEMLKRADLALYRAKESGRNRHVAG